MSKFTISFVPSNDACFGPPGSTPKRHLNQLIRFCTADGRVFLYFTVSPPFTPQTDRHCYYFCNTRRYLHSTAMRPNNDTMIMFLVGSVIMTVAIVRIYPIHLVNAVMGGRQPSDQANRLGPRIGGCAPLGSEAGSPSNTVSRAKAYLPTKWHLDPCSRLATIDMCRKSGSC